MKIFSFFIKSFFALMLLMVIFWVIILGALQTATGQKWAFHQIKGYLEQITDTQIQVKQFQFSFPFNIHLEDIHVLQNDRPMLNIETLDLCCSSFRLLQGRMIFSKMQVSNIHIFEFPKSTIHATHFLPLYLKFENMDIQGIKIDPLLMDHFHLPQKLKEFLKTTSLNLQGMIANHPFQSALTAHLLMTAKDKTPFSLGLDTQNDQLSFSFHFNSSSSQEMPLHLPAGLSAHLALYATAPLSTWQNFIQHSLQEEPIEGHFKLTLEDSLPSSLVGQQTTLQGRYLLKSQEAIELVDLKMDSPLFFLEGKGILTSHLSIDQGYFKGKIHRLEPLQPWLGQNVEGHLTFEGNVIGSLQSPFCTLKIESPQLIIANQLFQNIHSTLQTSLQKTNLKGVLNLSLDYQGFPWKAVSAFDWNHDQKTLSFSRLEMDVIHSHLAGELTCFFPQCLWNGFLEAHLSHLNDLSSFLPIPLHGEGALRLDFATLSDLNQKKRQAIHGELRGRSLRWRDGQAEQLVLNLHLDPLHSLVTEWKAQKIQWQGVHLQELTGRTTLDPSKVQWPFQLHGKGIWKEDLLFAAEGVWHYQKNALNMQWQQLKGRLGPYPFQLKQPLHMIKQTDSLQLTGVWLQWGEGEIQGAWYQHHESLQSDFKTNAVPLELFSFIAPDLPLDGHTTFAGHLEGTLAQPKGQFEVNLHDIHPFVNLAAFGSGYGAPAKNRDGVHISSILTPSRSLADGVPQSAPKGGQADKGVYMRVTKEIFAQKPFLTGKLLVDLDENGIKVKGDLHGIGSTPLKMTGRLPTHFSLEPFHFKINRQLPFELTLNAEGELDPYLHLFYHDIPHLSGHAQMALQFSGQMDAPQMKGYIHLTNGSYESLSTGAIYHNIQAHLEGENSKVFLKQFSARDTKHGEISATGVVHLDAHRQFPFEFHIHPSRIFILDSDYVTISASGPLTLLGNIKKSKLKGELQVDQAAIHLEEALPRPIKNIDIKYINLTQNGHFPHPFEKQETSSPLELDIKLNAPRNVSIQGNNLKSEWKGALTVTGTPGSPQLHGDLYLAKGEYDFNGKVFNLNQGNIHFAGAPGKKSNLYVVASKEIDRIRAEIIVKGSVNKPVISFRSHPPLPQREVLSYILFNRGISDITVDQGEQLSQSFISLNTKDQGKNSEDFLSRLRNHIGLDRLDFTANDNKENQDFGLQVGKHITKNVMVSVNQRMISLSPIIAVEAKLPKNLKVQAEAGVDEDTPIRMSIKWKKDY